MSIRILILFTALSSTRGIHNNPVKAELVANPEDYLYSSACDYAGEKGLIAIEFV